MYNVTNFALNKYISARFYNTFGENSVVFIVNEKSKKLVVLDDISANFLSFFINEPFNLSEFNSFIKKNQLENEVEEFISALVQLDILGDSSASVVNQSSCVPSSSEIIDIDDLLQDVQDIIYQLQEDSKILISKKAYDKVKDNILILERLETLSKELNA